MTTLYNCHTEGHGYRITKFDSLGNVEASYSCTEETCECPAGHRHTCRHREMLKIFIRQKAVDTFQFYDYDRGGWVTNEPIVEGRDRTATEIEQVKAPELKNAIIEGVIADHEPAVMIAAEAKPTPPPFKRRI